MDIMKELNDNSVILIMIDGSEYPVVEAEILTQLADRKLCYITLNKTYDAMKEILKKYKISPSNIVFLDGISKSFKASAPDKADNCYYISATKNFTELNYTIAKVMKEGFSYIVVDTVNTLLIYHDKSSVATFMAGLVNTVKSFLGCAVLYGIKLEGQTEAINATGIFVDRVIDLTK